MPKTYIEGAVKIELFSYLLLSIYENGIKHLILTGVSSHVFITPKHLNNQVLRSYKHEKKSA